MKRTRLLLLISVISLAQTGCMASRPNATAGGLFGGTSGGIVGAAIGSREGKTEEGALIGALAGGLTGAILGDQADQANFRNQQFTNQQNAISQQSAVTLDQVAQMSASGLSDDLIVNQIGANGLAQRLTTNDLIQLKSAGVSDRVIERMQAIGSDNYVTQPTFVAPQPVLVEPYCQPGFPAPYIHGRPIQGPFIPGPRGRRSRAGFSFSL